MDPVVREQIWQAVAELRAEVERFAARVDPEASGTRREDAGGGGSPPASAAPAPAPMDG